MDAVTYISVGIFLLVPYYLRIFLLNHNKTKGHIAFWITVHLLACVFYYVKLGEIFSIPFIVLIGCGGYYLVSYFFEVRRTNVSELAAAVGLLVNTKFFAVLSVCVLVMGSAFLAADAALLFFRENDLELYNKVYLLSVLVISYIQMWLYLWEYKRTFGEQERGRTEVKML